MSNKNYIYQLWEKKTGTSENEPQLVATFETKVEAEKVMMSRNIQMNIDCFWSEPDYTFEIIKVNRYKIEKHENRICSNK